MNTARRTVASIGALAAATTLVAMSPAQSATLTASKVTAQATDSTPASGQTFRLYGAVRAEGVKVPAAIKVMTRHNGRWVQLRGAIMDTKRDHNYRMRIILQMKGKQLLRVVADPASAKIGNSSTIVTVTVH